MSARRLTVTQWFALVVGLLLVVAGAGLVAGLTGLERQADRRALLLDRIDPAEADTLQLTAALIDQETGVRGFVLAEDERFLAPWDAGRADEAEILARLKRTRVSERLRADIADVERRAGVWRREYAQPSIVAVRAGTTPPPATLGKRRFDELRAAVRRQQAGLAAARTVARAELDRAASRSRALFLAAGGLVLLSLIAAAFALRRIVIVPLARLAGDVRLVAQGDFERPLAVSGPRELAELGHDVDAMRARIVDEVAALRQAEVALIDQARELQRSNEELEQFAYVASHDLQEPLRKIASFTQMLQRRYAGELDERADRYIEFAVDGAKRMQELINDLLAFSRVGRTSAAHERVDLAAVVAQACDRIAALVEETGGEVRVDGELPTVLGDAGLLTTVFQNLIANGIKFRGEAPPVVAISAEREGDRWRFAVTDNGIGIDDEYGERIFVIFQRLHTREAYDGTGIGLAMCRKIIAYHGGRIALAPAASGRGARFEFTLPGLPGDAEREAVPGDGVVPEAVVIHPEKEKTT